MDFFLCMTSEEISWDKHRNNFKYLASKKLSRLLKYNRPREVGLFFHVFAGIFPVRQHQNNSLHCSLHMLNYFLWEMWMLGGTVLSPCHYQHFPNLFFIWFCSSQSPLPWRRLHCWKAQKVWQARITHSQPTDQMADKHHEWRKAFLHKAHVPSSNLTAEGLLYAVGSLGGALVPSNAGIFQNLHPD